MEDSDRSDDVDEVSISFPILGDDKTPTQEMLAAGKVGSGAWNLTDGSVQLAYEEHHRQIKEDRDERRRHFNEESKNALSDAVRFHQRIIARGHLVMDKLENGETVSHVDSKILDMAFKSSKELADRGMGRAATAQPEVEKKGLLSILARNTDAS